MSTAQDLPYGDLVAAAPALRLVPSTPLDFDDAVKRVRPRLHRYAIRRLGDAHEAEELVQEALLRAYTHREQLLTEEDLSAWTTVVTGRLVIDRLRVRGRSTTMADVPEGARVGRDTADVVVARDEARTALDALDAMPARQAALLWAREVEGHSYEELCARFAMTEPAVRSVLTRARKALRKEYALRGGTLPVGGLAVLAPWISGLTFADKLRRVVTRVTAPAALGAIGITALGGLVLSPFGFDPATGTGSYNPAQAVVTSVSTRSDVPAHRLLATSPGRPHPTTHHVIDTRVEPVQPSTGYLLAPIDKVCGPNVSGAGCSKNANRTDTYVAVPLPANPTDLRYLGTEQNLLPCSSIPVNPVLVCTTHPANGAKS